MGNDLEMPSNTVLLARAGASDDAADILYNSLYPDPERTKQAVWISFKLRGTAERLRDLADAPEIPKK